MKKLLQYLFITILSNKKFFFINIILTIFNTGFSILIPLFFKYYIDKISINKSLNETVLLLGAFVLITLLSNFFSIVWHLAMTKIGTNMLFKLRENLLNKIANADYLKLRQIGFEKIKNIIFQDTLTIFINTANYTIQILTKLIIFLCILIILFFISKLVFAFMILAFSLGLIIANISRKKIYVSSKLMNKEFKNHSSFINIFIDSLKLIQTNNISKYYQSKHQNLCVSFIKTSLRNDKTQVLFRNLQANLNSFFSILFITFIYLNHNQVSPGNLILLFFYTNLVFSYSQEIESIISSVGNTLPSFENIKTVMELHEKSGQTKIEKISEIKFDNVCFKYPDSENEVLRNSTFSLKTGQVINLQGTNGCGKTTLISLILNLYRQTSGKIFINNRDINSIEHSSFISKALYLDQDEKFIDDDINTYFNLITQMNQNPHDIKNLLNEWEMWENKKESIDDIILNYNGVNLSSGQKRKLNIIRLILCYKQADLIILDECDANLDIGSKEKLNQLKKQLFNNTDKIIIDITHSDQHHDYYTHYLKITDQAFTLVSGKFEEKQGSD